MHLLRLARTAVLTAACAAALPATASAAECPPQPTTKPFVALGDQGDYFLAPGGDFEGGAPWSLTGGATVRVANKPLDVSGVHVADLPSGAAATSPELCVDVSTPHLRFTTRAGDDDDRLRVDAMDAATGAATTLGVLGGDDFENGWWVTPVIPLAAPLAVAEGEARNVRLRLTAVRGRWQADGVLVDPFVRR